MPFRSKAKYYEGLLDQYHRKEDIIAQVEQKYRSSNLRNEELWFRIAEALITNGIELDPFDLERYVCIKNQCKSAAD